MGEAIIKLDQDQLKKHFFESYELIREGEITNDETRFGRAIACLKDIVEPIVRGLYQESKKLLSEAEIAQIESTFIGKQGLCEFNNLSMGDELSVLYLGYTSASCVDNDDDGGKRTRIDLINLLEKKYTVKLKSVRKLQQEFVHFRNISEHSKSSEGGSEEPITLDDSIRQQNNVSAVLGELGFDGYTTYQVTKFNRFVEELQRCERRYTRILGTNFELDKGILPNLEEEGGGRWKINKFLNELAKPDNKNYMIVGAGGAGKSTILRYISEEFRRYNDKFNGSPAVGVGWDFRPIPIMISATELSFRNEYDIDTFLNDISRLTRQDHLGVQGVTNDEPIAKKAERLVKLWDCGDVRHKPFFIVLIDGLNEIAGCSEQLQEAFNNIFRKLEGSHIKVVVTSRDKSLAIESGGNFRAFHASELGAEQIKTYIEQRSSSTSRESSRGQFFFDVLNNPMMLTLYTSYQDFAQSSLDKEILSELRKNHRMHTIEAEDLKRSYILWNFVQYSILFGKVYVPYLEAEKTKLMDKKIKKWMKDEEVRNVLIVSEILPLLAWHMVSKGSVAIERLSTEGNQTDELKKLFAQRLNDIRDDTNADPGLRKILEVPEEMDEALDYLVKIICILTYEDNKLKFIHQNFRDFFAASYLIKNYMSLTGRRGSISDLHEQLSSSFIPSELRVIVGELLDGLSQDGEDPLAIILNEYQEKCNAGDSNDCAVVNIFDINKAMGTLDLTQYINTDMDRLNLNDVEMTNILHFIEKALNAITMDSLASGYKLIGKSEKSVAMIRLQNLLMLSLRFASNLKKTDVRTILEIWLVWIRKLYNNSTDAPSKGFKSRLVYAMMSIDKLKVYLLTEVLNSFVFEGNMGIGDNNMVNVFHEVSTSKPSFEKSMIILKKEAKGIENSDIIDSILSLASSGGLASNFVSFILAYYLVSNPVEAFELNRSMREEAKKKGDPKSKVFVRFRSMSGINFATQESLFIKGRELFDVGPMEDASELKKGYVKFMKELLTDEMDDLTLNNEAYRSFDYGYYFPFGIMFAFGCATKCKDFENDIYKKIFGGDIRSNVPLLQKVLLDLASVSSCTFFAQSEAARMDGTIDKSYLDTLFTYLGGLIKGICEADFGDNIELKDEIWNSLGESLAIFYCSNPWKTEEFLDAFVRENTNKISLVEINRVLGLKNNLRSLRDNPLVHLCNAKYKGDPLTIDEFVENKKNVWIFADLAVNMFLSFPNLTKALTVWGDDSFYHNIETYEDNPKSFVKNSVKQLIYLLEHDSVTERLFE